MSLLKKKPTDVDEWAEPPAPEPPAPPVALTQEQFAQLLSAISTQRDGGLDASTLQEVMRTAREPIPEQKVHHGISHYQPGGRENPNPPFKWPEIWWAAVDEKGDAHPLHPFDWERHTRQEIEAINTLVPVRGKVTFMDGSQQDVQVIEERTVGGDIKRLLIGFSIQVFKDRDKRNAIGALPQLCRQLTELAHATV